MKVNGLFIPVEKPYFEGQWVSEFSEIVVEMRQEIDADGIRVKFVSGRTFNLSDLRQKKNIKS